MSPAPLAVVPEVSERLIDAQDAEIERLTALLAEKDHALERIGRAALQFHGDSTDEQAQAGFDYIRALAAKARKGR